ncbi:hypothetical protein [Paraburkholderia unamae]|uniref:Uncharacterized protein n=1 Tax=Paraburkholderia unamae TaxID=219649 RepID=A0ACC6RW10_9BURK
MPLHVTTKATLIVARKLIENAIKGNPAFKPYKGEHGQASWFLIEGNPHTGVANQGKDVVIHAEIDEAFVQKDETLVQDQIAETNRNNKGMIDSRPKEFDLAVWNAIGRICSARTKATNLKVPKCKLSANPGRFLVLPPAVSHALHIDFSRFDSDNLTLFSAEKFSYEAYKREREEYESQKDARLDRVLTLWIGPYRGPEEQAVRHIDPVYTAVKKDVGTPVIEEKFYYRIFNFKKSGWGAQPTEQVDGYYRAVSLTYPNYREAKNAFKRILTNHSQNAKVHCYAGTNWYDSKKHETVSVSGVKYSGAVEADVLGETYTNF